MSQPSYDQEHLRNVVKGIALSKNFSENSTVLFSDGKEKDDGYFGVIVRIVVRDKWKILDLVAKMPIMSERVKSIAPIEEAYENELQFYENIFPELDRLQRKFKIQKLFNSVPKFYKINLKHDEKFIIMENLKKLEYKMFDPKTELDEEHCRMICEMFGKFHALSFALKFFKPESYIGLVEKLQCLYLGYMKYKGGLIKQCCEVVQQYLNEIGESCKMIDHYVEHVESIYKNILFESKNDTYSCILHCDAWLNNMMFQYKVESPVRDRGGQRNPKHLRGEELPLDPRVPPLYTDALTDDNNPDLIPPTNEGLLDSSITPFIISARPSSKRNCATQMPVKPYHVTWAPMLQSRNCSTQTPPPHKESSV